MHSCYGQSGGTAYRGDHLKYDSTHHHHRLYITRFYKYCRHLVSILLFTLHFYRILTKLSTYPYRPHLPNTRASRSSRLRETADTTVSFLPIPSLWFGLPDDGLTSAGPNDEKDIMAGSSPSGQHRSRSPRL